MPAAGPDLARKGESEYTESETRFRVEKGGNRAVKGLGKGRRGVSLAYVIVTAMALLILCGALAAAAARNLDLTVDSLDGRQAYLTAKSAVEYAKGEVLRELQNGGPQDFSVGSGSGGAPFRIVTPKADPDGVDVLASCVKSGDGVKISAKVKYRNSARFRTFGYTFSLEQSGGFEAPFDGYMVAGARYGSDQILNGDNHLKGTTCPFPALFKIPIVCQGSIGTFKAPSMYFIGGLRFTAADDSATLAADLVCFNGDLTGSRNSSQHPSCKLRCTGSEGVVWFNGTTITLTNTSDPQKGFSRHFDDGPYYFRNGTDLFDSDDLDSLTPVESSDYQDLKDEGIMDSDQVNYILQNYPHIFSSEDIRWTIDGQMRSSPSDQTGNDVFVFTKDQGDLQNSDNTYRARSIMMLNAGGPFSVRNGRSVELRADTVWLCGGTGMDDAFQTTQTSQNSLYGKFRLSSSDGTGKVVVMLPNGLQVKRANGSQYHVEAGDYTVDSGLDLYDAGTDAEDFTSIDSGGGSGGGPGGGAGGWTISGGTYTNS